MNKKNHITFILFFLLPVAIAGILFLPYQLLITQTGEQADPAFIAEELASDKQCIYARATLMGAEAEDFKPLQYKYLKSGIVIVGSSRSMQFKSQYFNQPSFTFGGTVHNIYGLRAVITETLKNHKPKAMILQMDYWWFNPKYLRGIEKKRQLIYKRFRDNLKLAYEPYIWLAKGKLTKKQFIDAILGLQDQGTCKLGIMGTLQHKGYVRDGSYFYGSKYTEFNEEDGFFEEIEAIDDETFRSGGDPNTIDEERLKIFVETLEQLDREKIDYVIVFPPFAPNVYAYLEGKQPGFLKFMNTVVRRVKDVSKAKVYNFHDPATIQTTNCEFLDGDHGGQTSYARILYKLKNSSIRAYLDLATIKRDIKELNGRTISPEELQRFMPGQKEVDFLNLGCQK